ncbi:hypothetical protein [Pseudobutyrivibrio xylanivorans]|uniref:Uncharacterized protein n=1 Tax=Pseudobutyrivibrio xylanivorans TaxID=185007 RepID=A0A5P6VNT1_PSEXY|nr:hypothetical protein [Pseudobutyrivibrio xylanivorans]QFJ54333.1 hypothetical protein FXF36_05430 [Pseudobutyrivibrio xylanivorans]
MCLLQGVSITPEMAGTCRFCSLYLNTCMPIVDNGFVFGECDKDYCIECPCYGECEDMKGGCNE